MAIDGKTTLSALILSLFPSGTGNISAADNREYLGAILDSNVLQSFAAVTDAASVIPLSVASIDQNAPRLPTNVTSTVYQLPDVSLVKEGVTLIIINKTSVQRNISLFAGDTIAGLLQIDKPGVWTVTADPANNSWLSIFNLFNDLIELLATNETDRNKALFPQGDGSVAWESIGFIKIESTQDWIDNTVDLGGDKRQMLPGATYNLLTPVSRSFSLVCNGINAVRSDNFSVAIDTYTGSSNSSFESDNVAYGLVTRGVQMVSLSAQWLDFTDTFGFFGSNATVDCKDLGFFNANSGASVYFTENFQHGSSSLLTKGLTFDGSGFTISITNSAFLPDQSATLSMINLATSTWQNIRIADLESNAGAPNTVIEGLASGANLLAGGAGFVNHTNFGLSTTPLIGVSQADDPWIFTGNVGVPDSGTSLGGSVDSNATVTTIGTVNTPVQADVGVLAQTYESERMSMSTAGVITNDGINQAKLTVIFTGIADTASGVNVDFTFYVAKNGTIIPGSRGPVSLDAADPGGFVAQALVDLDPANNVSLFVECNSGTTNITIIDFSVTVK